ncbi:MAG: hypothetical protein M1840_005913 [Geoglossum simile]|nr:MAG: hypothetical protein M1840_005913 [Geoglossum simile]
MLTQLPAELLSNILSCLVYSSPLPQSRSRYSDCTVSEDALCSLGSTSRRLQASTREFRTHLLRSRLSRIPHIDLLLAIWSPPMFFRRQHGSATPCDPHDVLLDQDTYSEVDAYLTGLEWRGRTAERIADNVLPLLALPATSDFREFTTIAVLHLWSVQARYSHDVDGVWDNVQDEIILDVLLDDYIRALPPPLQRAVIDVYNALSRKLEPPFCSHGQVTEDHTGVEGMWLYRLLVKAIAERKRKGACIPPGEYNAKMTNDGDEMTNEQVKSKETDLSINLIS